jgi:hypothetical protein
MRRLDHENLDAYQLSIEFLRRLCASPAACLAASVTSVTS